MTVQVIWRLLMLASRVLALTLYIIVFEYQIVYVLALHWVFMFIWILTMKTSFCDNRFEEIIYNALLAIMFIFCYFNPIDNDTRYRYALFYAVMLCENTALLIAWYTSSQAFNSPLIFIAAYYLLFALGITTMIYYYLVHHPSRAVRIIRDEVDALHDEVRCGTITREAQRKNFNPRDWATEQELQAIRHLIESQNDVNEEEFKRIGIVKRRFTIDASAHKESGL